MTSCQNSLKRIILGPYLSFLSRLLSVSVLLSGSAWAFTFEQWKHELRGEAKAFTEVEELRIETLPRQALLIATYPRKLSLKVLSWVGAGGSLFLTLNAESAEAAKDVMSALDLIARVDQAESEDALMGAWPFPNENERASRGQHHLLAPWITWRPLTFTEGQSWFKGEIPPIAIDQHGHSLAYRVRYGKGTLTVFGDGDALSDQMRVIGENRRFSQSVMSMLMTRAREEPQLSQSTEEVQESLGDVFYVRRGGLIISTLEEQSLRYQAEELIKMLKKWWSKHAPRTLNLYHHLRYALLALIGLTLIYLSRLLSPQTWKKQVIIRRSKEDTRSER